MVALFLSVFACKGTSVPQGEPPLSGPVPLSSGTFWQLGTGRLATWNDQKLADEVRFVKQAGMDVIMLQYSAVWDSEQAKYRTYIPDAGFEMFPGLGARDPLGAIFKAAEEQGVNIIIGDFLAPINLRYEKREEAFSYWLSDDAMRFRRMVIERFKDSPVFYAYYIANEPNPYRIKTAADTQAWIDGTREVARFVKSVKPGLKVIHSIGLYAEWHTGSDGVARPSPPSDQHLDDFWRPWVSGIPQVDAWMMIDGIGTRLSSLSHTDGAQAWGRQLVHGFNKEFWVDVENAVMTSEYYPFDIETLVSSLEVAAKHADKIVFFEHLSYMSPNSDRDTAKKLYEDYLLYRQRILNP